MCIRDREQEILRERGVDERIVHATASHGYALTVEIEPEHEMEKVLYAVDELTGLIGAVALMRPSKSVSDLELKSVKKKFKSTNFAAGCSREMCIRDRCGRCPDRQGRVGTNRAFLCICPGAMYNTHLRI